MENVSPHTLSPTMSKPLLPISPERMNASRQPIPQSPSLPAFTTSASSSPTRDKNSDVQGMVARFNALDIKDHQELGRRQEAAVKRAQMGREQAEEECRRAKEEMRALRRDVEEGRERERRVAKRVESVMEQLHSEKEKTASMQKTYEREIRRARKEAFKSSSALLETQKELKVTRAALNAAKVNLEKWVIPDGEELKARAEGVEMELGKALRLVEHMKMECQFGVCSCRVAEMKGDVFVADGDEQVLELMKRLKPSMADIVMDEQPPAYEEPQRQDSVMDETPTPAPESVVEEKGQLRSMTPRRSSTVTPAGDMMVYSPNSGTFRRAEDSASKLHAQPEHQPATAPTDAGSTDPDTSCHDFANNEPKTPTTPATSVQAFSPKHHFSLTEDEQDDGPDEEIHVKKEHASPGSETGLPGADEEVCTVEDPDETLDEDGEDPLESPTAHIRATTQVTTVPLAPLSSPTKPAENDETSEADGEPERSLHQPDFKSNITAARGSRATTPLPQAESEEQENEAPRRVAPTTPKIDTNLASAATVTPAPKSAGNENILSSTPWKDHATTPLTRDDAIAMLRARRGRARSNAADNNAPGSADAGNTPKRSASHGQGLGRKGGAITPGRRDISTVSAPDLGGRTPGGRKR